MARTLKLGLNTGYWAGGPPAGAAEAIAEAERLGGDSIWTAESDGAHSPLPRPDGTGLGKPLKSSIHPLREDIPIYLGAEGPKNVAMCAELCDGWLAMLFSPTHEEIHRAALEEGFARPGARRTAEEFEVAATVPLIVSDDIDSAVDALRPFYALYLGGMGAKAV